MKGSHDSGVTVRNNGGKPDEIMKKVGKYFGIGEHIAGRQISKRIVGPADVEVHVISTIFFSSFAIFYAIPKKKTERNRWKLLHSRFRKILSSKEERKMAC